MHVVATAGHVDHGKSTLVRALTGMEPDRWEEERRRGLTIDLGFAWMTLPGGEQLAFVDVPGHERFLTNMLAGVGPVPAVLFVVAADEGWQAQSQEHLDVLDALGVGAGVVAVTKADRGDAAAVVADVNNRLRTTSLRGAPVVTVSAQTGAGLDELRDSLVALVAALPEPDADAPVRFWVDRAFTVHGAGTVVTGTLTAGRIRVGDDLLVAPAGRVAVVRGLESAKQRVQEATGVARVAVNLRGVDRDEVRRGDALVRAGRWTTTGEFDVVGERLGSLPREVVVHVGSAAVPAMLRLLGDAAARVRMHAPLPLHVGDRVLLRDPASRRIAGADVADVAPMPIRRRGGAAALAAELRVPATADELVEARGAVSAAQLLAAGFVDAPLAARQAGTWWVAPRRWAAWAEALPAAVPERGGVDVESLVRALAAPDADVVRALVADDPSLVVSQGRVARADATEEELPALAELTQRLASRPLAAPEAEEIAALGRATLAAGVRRGQLLHLGGAVYVAPTAPEHALRTLATLPAPFSVSDARQALGVSRRVAVPLLEHLDAARRTRKLPDGTRLVVPRQG